MSSNSVRQIPTNQDWGPEELDFVYELNEVLRKRVVDLANTENIPPTQAYNRIRQEDLDDAIEDRARNHRY
jgi:hypothetical protein